MEKTFQSDLLKKYIKINFLVIFLPIAIATTIYCTLMQKNYMENYLDTIEYTSTDDMQKLDEMMRSFSSTALQISLDRELSPYYLTNNTYDSIKAVKKLRSYLVGLQYFDEIAICLNDSDTLYTGLGTVTINTFVSNTYLPSSDYSSSEFIELLRSKQCYGCTTEGEYMISGQNSTRYSVITYPLGKTAGKQYGTLIGLYPDEMEKTFGGYSGSKDNRIIMLCTSTLEPVYTQLPEMLKKESLQEDAIQTFLVQLNEMWSEDRDVYEVRFASKAYIGKVIHSDVNEWYLIDMVEKSSISRNIFFLQLPMLLVVIMSLLLLTILLSLVLSIYNYVPIRRLSRLFDKKAEQKEKKNELLFLNDYIRKLMDDQNDIEEQLDATRHISRIELVKRLLRGNIDYQSTIVQEQRYNLEINLDTEYMAAIVVKKDKEKANGYTELLRNALSQITRNGFYLTEMIYKDYFAFLACPENPEDIREFAEYILEFLGEESDSVHIGLGNVYYSPESLKYSLMEALIAVESKEERIISFSSISKQKSEELYRKPLENELKLKQVLIQGTAEDLDNVMEGLYKELIHIGQANSDTVLHFIMNRIFSSLFEITQGNKENEEEQFLHYTDLEEFFENLKTFCRIELNQQIVRKAAQNEKRMQSIIQFIDEYFMQQNMSLAFIAETFDMSSSYLSRIFKVYTGVNFIDYITNKRLEMSAELLETSDYNISQVVEMVGYSDTASFTRKFTRNFSMSPGNYRKVKNEKKSEGRRNL